MRISRFAKVLVAFFAGVMLAQLLHACSPNSQAAQKTRLTIATVNNGDMVVIQGLSRNFEQANPDIQLRWVVLEENVLRQRTTTDVASQGGQFDVLTIGSYEAPIWARRDWLRPLDLPASYDVNDLIKPVREGLSYNGQLYAVPFYAESSMLYYRKDLFEKAGITVPQQPTYPQMREWASKIHDPKNGVYGVCLRGKPGWGENMAFLTTLVNTYGGRWFDMKWQPTINTPNWKEAIGFYVDLLNKYGPPGASSNGFNENLALFSTGKCGMWVDATVAAGLISNPKESQVYNKVGFARAPIERYPNGSNWLWAWALAIPKTSKSPEAAQRFIAWATSKEYIQLVANQNGWVAVPPGTRISTYQNPNYQKAAPFAGMVLNSIQSADITRPSAEPTPYKGVQYVDIPEFQAIGTSVGQTMAAALTNNVSIDRALQQAQSSTERFMRHTGYIE
ncbi:sugar ABC transporter substrate-binding protein [Planktothrix sp. FACHB-1355]|uniref:Sugar ABC transporter substrate-binding protein n=1 Tax=Aerosakkonema funiforme FACHB-1375 TaxID=2949571 RepID=A0A926VG49_9CYAN|nr:MULTISPECIES: sugar ABC transporter substrate-binding protein [Oscillatoriales]MBD2183103.1 sugar ABC transporter substrate-binding protein [Aerosakkonema funiforme FACHB-1375]MBD3559533.1 sugar ABC transporter substrate-binding protein [Planktothrix sp. FACHB-1355]